MSTQNLPPDDTEQKNQKSPTTHTNHQQDEFIKERFFKRLKKLRRDYWFDRKEANRAVYFFTTQLYHIDGEFAGLPFVPERWQRRIIRRIFGWKRKDAQGNKLNIRKYRVVFFFLPRKNGKSTMGAGLGLYLLDADREPGAQVVSAASDREQAGIVFEMAKRMVEYNPAFARRGIVPLRRAIPVYRTGSTYKTLSADVKGKHGKNLHAILFDELHEQPNRHLYDTLKTSMGTRRQPLQVYFTTAGYDQTTICYEMYEHAKKIQDGVIEDESFLPVLYEAGPNDDWRDEKTWYKANPNLGKSIKLDYLREEFKQAMEIPAFENTFKRLYLNIWTEQEIRLIPMDTWREQAEKVEIESLLGLHCYGGLDLASVYDIAALLLAFPEPGTKRVRLLPKFYVPLEAAKDRTHKKRIPYMDWVDQGFMTATPGNTIDYDYIRRDVNELGAQFHIKSIAYDRWNAMQLVTQLAGDGFIMVPFGQGYASMSDPTKYLMKLIMSKELIHGNNPVLTWMASNVAGEQDAAGNLKPSKKKSKEKIDGIVASVMALGRLTLEEADESHFGDRGLIVL